MGMEQAPQEGRVAGRRVGKIEKKNSETHWPAAAGQIAGRYVISALL
jgi:hypothetical protein